MSTQIHLSPWISTVVCFVLLVMINSKQDVLGNANSQGERKVYIVYLGNKISTDQSSSRSLHLRMINDVVQSNDDGSRMIKNAEDLLVHSHARSFNGFSARLTVEEAEKLKGMEGVVSLIPSMVYGPWTTMSWDFIGFPRTAIRDNSSESDVVIGVIDTGIRPEHESFNDDGIGPPPKKWKGICQSSKDIKCNNKIIGARYYNNKGYPYGEEGNRSPLDTIGHGTHTAAIVAGRVVAGASLDGYVKGTARGGVPSARIAIYKVCGVFVCYGEDISAAFDDAIADGVDIIVTAVSSGRPLDYFEDVASIGAFHAVRRGILTVLPASNGPYYPFSVTSNSPWALTVGATTMDRKFMQNVILGDGREVPGFALEMLPSQTEFIPLMYAGDAPNKTSGFTSELARNCSDGSLDTNLLKGKIVVCEDLAGDGCWEVPGVAVCILSSYVQRNDMSIIGPVPTAAVGFKEGILLKRYAQTGREPKAKIIRSESFHDPESPMVASFSARGPNTFTPDILKPDMVAPGVNILAAWDIPLSFDLKTRKYSVVSGSSTAAAHATAIAAYVKSFHPSWSPAAIKSALMTSAYPLDPTKNEDREFGYGSGQLNPSGAINPGLVYDAHEQDYQRMLCNQGYDTQKLRAVTCDLTVCAATESGTVWDLNYPSISLSVTGHSIPFRANFRRTATNVGPANSIYHAVIDNEHRRWLNITVEPELLSFTSLNEKKSFLVTIEGSRKPSKQHSASLVWSDGFHRVRSPIIVFSSSTFNHRKPASRV